MPSVEHILAYDRNNQKHAGSSPNEKLFLWSLLHMSKYPKMLEIGVSRGHLTLWFALAQKAHKGEVVSVDNWSMSNGGAAASCNHALKRLEDNGLSQYVTFVNSDSKAFLANSQVGAFDFIWIDGDHTYEGALADIELALALSPKMIGVHDTAQGYAGPRNACRAIETILGKQGTWVDGLRGIWLYTV